MNRLKKLVFFLLLILGGAEVSAQSDSVALRIDSCACGEKNLVLDFVEEMPAPVRGCSEWQSYLMSNIRLSDSSLRKAPGKVYITFVVDPGGNVCSAFVRKGCPQAPEFDSEALRIVTGTKWTPGKMNGKAVCVRMTLPVQICLTE